MLNLSEKEQMFEVEDNTPAKGFLPAMVFIIVILTIIILIVDYIWNVISDKI